MKGHPMLRIRADSAGPFACESPKPVLRLRDGE